MKFPKLLDLRRPFKLNNPFSTKPKDRPRVQYEPLSSVVVDWDAEDHEHTRNSGLFDADAYVDSGDSGGASHNNRAFASPGPHNNDDVSIPDYGNSYDLMPCSIEETENARNGSRSTQSGNARTYTIGGYEPIDQDDPDEAESTMSDTDSDEEGNVARALQYASIPTRYGPASPHPWRVGASIKLQLPSIGGPTLPPATMRATSVTPSPASPPTHLVISLSTRPIR